MRTMVDDGILFKLLKSTVVIYIVNLVILIILVTLGHVYELGGGEINIFSLSYNVFLELNLYDKAVAVSALIAIFSSLVTLLLIIFDIFLSKYNDIKNGW